MASIRKEIALAVAPAAVWDAVRDVGNVHRRLFPGILTDARLDGDARVVTFANGMVLRELIVDIDDDARRFVYASVGGSTSHHNASIQVLPDGTQGSRLIWITDLLPDERRAPVAGLMHQGIAVLKQTLERARTAGD